jgi:hypothetical protein
MAPTRFSLVLLTGLMLWAGTPDAAELRQQSLAFGAPQYEVEDLMAELQAGGDVIYVTGRIRNLSQAPVKGYVVVYFRNANNQPLHAVEVEVNQNKVFGHGEAGFFEATANIVGISDVANVAIEFVDQPTPLQKPRSRK